MPGQCIAHHWPHLQPSKWPLQRIVWVSPQDSCKLPSTSARCCDQGRHHFRLPSHPTKRRFGSSLKIVSYRKPGVNPSPPSCGKVATYASTPVAPVLKATTVGPSGNTEEHSYVFRQTMGSLQMCAEGLRFGVIAVSTQWRESRVWSRLPLGAGDCAS